MHRHQTPTPQTPYPNVLLLPQSSTTAILRGALDRAGVTVEFNAEIREVAQDDLGATAVLEGGGSIRARYIVGADGAASVVRKSINVSFEGSTDESDKMIIAMPPSTACPAIGGTSGRARRADSSERARCPTRPSSSS
jgi:2-polyprenyl-6-methoxyphenol hydroxylase-like FAD-dependent oxidoreductase